MVIIDLYDEFRSNRFNVKRPAHKASAWLDRCQFVILRDRGIHHDTLSVAVHRYCIDGKDLRDLVIFEMEKIIEAGLQEHCEARRVATG